RKMDALHRALPRWHAGTAAQRAQLPLRLAAQLRVEGTQTIAQGNRNRGRSSMGQLGDESLQSRSSQIRRLGRPDFQRDVFRLLPLPLPGRPAANGADGGGKGAGGYQIDRPDAIDSRTHPEPPLQRRWFRNWMRGTRGVENPLMFFVILF